MKRIKSFALLAGILLCGMFSYAGNTKPVSTEKMENAVRKAAWAPVVQWVDVESQQYQSVQFVEVTDINATYVAINIVYYTDAFQIGTDHKIVNFYPNHSTVGEASVLIPANETFYGIKSWNTIAAQ